MRPRIGGLPLPDQATTTAGTDVHPHDTVLRETSGTTALPVREALRAPQTLTVREGLVPDKAVSIGTAGPH
jgi:hypothetical protein